MHSVALGSCLLLVGGWNQGEGHLKLLSVPRNRLLEISNTEALKDLTKALKVILPSYAIYEDVIQEEKAGLPMKS